MPIGAQAETRIALVIGNSSYENVERLTNPANDAVALAASLEAIGFDKVQLALDLDYPAMRRALGDFSRSAAGADIAVIYFAGHGIEIGGTNYLIPTDAALAHADDVEFEAVPLQTVLHALSRAGKLKLVVLDACRNNPFAREMQVAGATRSIGRGLARVEPRGSDTLVAYAAREGTVAADGTGENSPYAAALIKHINTTDIDVRLLFGRVRDEVRSVTGGQQEPFTYGSLGGEQIYLASGTPQETTPSQPAPGGPGTQVTSDAAQAWDAIKDTERASDLRAFIEVFPDSFYARLAQSRLVAMEEQEVAVGIFPEVPAGADPSRWTPGETFSDCEDCPAMVVVPAGEFLMGSPPDEKYHNQIEGPQHVVTIASPFAIGKYEVTRADFAAFVAESGYRVTHGCNIHNNKEWITDPNAT